MPCKQIGEIGLAMSIVRSVMSGQQSEELLAGASERASIGICSAAVNSSILRGLALRRASILRCVLDSGGMVGGSSVTEVAEERAEGEDSLSASCSGGRGAQVVLEKRHVANGYPYPSHFRC